MAHVAASVNRLYETQLLTAVNSPKRGITPPNAKSDAPSADPETADFQALFSETASESSSNSVTNSNSGATTSSPASTSSTQATSASDSVPTPESVFGGSPWLANPVGKNPDGSEYSGAGRSDARGHRRFH
jgi:hypothetical protein